MKVCSRQDFAKVGAETIYNETYKDNDLKQYLICIDDPFNLSSLEHNDFSKPLKNVRVYVGSCLAKDCASEKEVKEFMGSFLLEQRIIYKQVDFTRFDGMPARVTDNVFVYSQLSQESFAYNTVPIRKNQISLDDNFIQLGLSSE